MSKGMTLVGIIILGVLTFGLINIIQGFSTGSELDYTLLRDTTEASMFDAVDIGYYQSTGQLRIDKEKFTESFVRRFAQNINRDRNYNIRIYDINETPPKVSIKIGSSTVATFASENWDIKNQLDGILETKYSENRILKDLYDLCVNSGSSNCCQASGYNAGVCSR